MVDIIIPVFNVRPYLEQCLQSVLNQTTSDINVIIVDDGSTDGSASVCDKYSTLNNVKVIHQTNGGQSSARNTGLNNSNSEYVMFVDSDDWIEQNTVEHLLAILKDTSADVACGGFFFEYKNKTIRHSIGTSGIRLYNNEEALKEVLARRSIGYAPWGKLYKRILFDGVEFPIGKIHEDYDVTPKVLLKSNKVVVTDKALFHYRQRNVSTSHTEYSLKNYDLYLFSVSNRYILDVYPSLKDAYYASLYTSCKDLLTLFKTKETKKTFINDYKLYRNEIRHNIPRILSNKCLTFKGKFSILSILVPFRTKINDLFKAITHWAI